MSEVQKKPEWYKQEHADYLLETRDSGVINMWNAVPFLMRKFPGLNEAEARDVLLFWMASF